MVSKVCTEEAFFCQKRKGKRRTTKPKVRMTSLTRKVNEARNVRGIRENYGAALRIFENLNIITTNNMTARNRISFGMGWDNKNHRATA